MKQMSKGFKAGRIIGALLCLFTLVWFALFLFNTNRTQNELSRTQLEEALRRSAVACYAEEGRYPDSVDYLIDRYGITVDESYRIEYDIFGENILPDIKVVEK